jgi:hypothetical protein
MALAEPRPIDIWYKGFFIIANDRAFFKGSIIVPIGCTYGRLRQRQRTARWLLLLADINELAIPISFSAAGDYRSDRLRQRTFARIFDYDINKEY